MLLEISSINCIILSRDFCCRKAGAVSSAMQKGDLLQQETKWSGQQSGRTEKGWSRKQNRRLFPEKCVSKDFCNNRLANFSSSLLPAMKTLLRPLKSRRRVGSPFLTEFVPKLKKPFGTVFTHAKLKEGPFFFFCSHICTPSISRHIIRDGERRVVAEREKGGLKKQGKWLVVFPFWEDFPLGPSCLGGGVGLAGRKQRFKKGKKLINSGKLQKTKEGERRGGDGVIRIMFHPVHN